MHSLSYIKILYTVNRLTTGIVALLSCLLALFPLFKTLAVAAFINSVVDFVADQKNSQRLLLSTTLLFLFYLVEYGLTAVLNLINNKFQLQGNSLMEDRFLSKIDGLDFEAFEDNEINNLVDVVREGIGQRFFGGFQTILSLIGYSVRILSIILVLFSRSVPVGLITLIMFVLIVPLAKRAGEEDYSAYEEGRKQFRRAKAIREALIVRDYADERGLFSFSEYFNALWKKHFSLARQIDAQAMLRNYLKTAVSSVSTTVICVVMAITLIPFVRTGRLSTGLYIGIVSQVLSLVHMMSWDFANILENFVSNTHYLSDYYRFMALPENEKSGDLQIGSAGEPISMISFKDVTFCYPNSQTPALLNFSYDFAMGKHYALVGPNGAGKSTLAKLMMGLYRNYTGEILLDGRELRTYTRAELLGLVSIVYQDFVKYQISIRDNVMIGSGCSMYGIEDDERAIDVLGKIGLWDKIKILSKGLDTALGKVGGEGIDLSGGEWQRIAVARSLINDAQIFILDEPTASFDSISESNLYKLHNSLFKAKTTITITHRLGNVKDQDCILVISGGELKESGRHVELMRLKGFYSEMYGMQRSWYDEA